MTSDDGERGVRVVLLEDLDLRYRSLRLPPLANDRLALEDALKRHVLLQPLLATDSVAVGKLVLLDGFKRYEALAAQGVTEAVTRILSLDEPSSMAALLAANSGRQGPSALEEAWVVESLLHGNKLNQTEVGKLLGRSKTWVCRRFQLVRKLEGRVQDDVRLGLITPATARELARLPRGNQAHAAEAVTRFDLSSRQALRLVDVLRDADPAGRRAILASPLDHLSRANRSSKPTSDARLSEEGNRVRQQLLRLYGAVNRLDELLLERAPGRFDERDLVVLRELTLQILAKTPVALDRLRQLVAESDEVRHAT